jgi:penicillin-binding protein 1A
LRVYTTLDLELQQVANKAVLDGTAKYERRHGWKGNLQNVILAGLDADIYKHPDWASRVVPGDYVHGMVTAVQGKQAVVKVGTQQIVTMGPEDWKWTQNNAADEFLKNGDLVYVRIEAMDPFGQGKATLQQDSGVQGSMMAMDNANGEVIAMVGGRDFALSQFNRATQSQRQVGSSFKPYVYTAALENGAKVTDIVVDGPVSFYTPNGPYTPHNYEPDWKGAMTLITAFAESRNIPALKLADHVGIRKVIEVAQRFGITSTLPPFLPIAIGAADITLAEQVGAYAVFPNDGIRIEPHYIRQVTQPDGVPLETHNPEVKEVISVDIARQMMILLQAVTKFGTGAAAAQLNHPLGGKTGTTNDYTDAWFVGFSPSVTCGTWIGFDDRQSLGSKETGAQAALPMWIDFMRAAIVGKDTEAFPTADAPKKVLAVPLTGEQPKKPAVEEPDPDDPDAKPTPAMPEKPPVASPPPAVVPVVPPQI